MSTRRLSNKDYLELYLAGSSDSVGKVLLPHESEAVEKAVEKQRNAYNEVIEQKKSVSGGDDWHDGAFVATDNEAKIIGQQMSAISPYIGAVVVDYPDTEETRASIGSRVLVNQDGYSFPVDVVGFKPGYPEGVTSEEFEDEVTGISPDSPLAGSILGKKVGFEGAFHNAGSDIKVKIERIDQSAIKQYFMREVQVIERED